MVGYAAGYKQTNYYYNVYIGSEAGYNDTTGRGNAVIGYKAGYTDTAIYYSTVIGMYAGYFVDPLQYSVIIGAYAGYGTSGNSTSYDNVIIGYYAGRNIQSSNDNVLIGYKAADSLTTGDHNICIGHETELNSNTTSNQLNIGNLIYGNGLDGSGTTISSGNIGIGYKNPTYKLEVNGNVKIGSTTNYMAVANTGDVSFQGTGRPIKEIWINSEGFRTPGTKPATYAEIGIGSAWEFTDGTDDTLFARIKVPDDMDTSANISIGIGWCTPTASAGNGRWQVEHLARASNEAMNAGADGTLVDNFAASSTAYGLVLSTVGSFSISSSDKCITLRIKRRADEIGDTLNEDCYLMGICFTYYANKLGG